MILLLLTAAVVYSVESTTGAVAGRHDPIYTHSVSSRRSANRTCGFPASGSLQDHAFAHGGSRAGADGRTRRNNMLGARRVVAVNPLAAHRRASGTTTGGADHGPERRQIQRHRQFADTSSTSSFAFTCGALRSSSTFRRGQTQSVNRLSLAPASTVPGPRVLPSTGITRLHRYYDPIRHPKGPVPCLTTPPLASTACQPPQGASRGQHRLPATPRGFPCCTQPLFHTCRRHYPGGTVGCSHRSLPQRRRPSPKFRRVGFRIALFEACSAFTARYGLCARQVPYGPSTPEASTGSLPPRPFRLLPAGTTFAGWDSHPLRLCTFARRTE